MARKLKVYRTPIGFHDAYVGTPSQKAALKAWGTDRNLFARGVAEEIDDPALIEEPLANPGIVIKRSRGTTAEQIAALPKDRPAKTSASKSETKIKGAAPPAAKLRRQPRPRRDELEAAEQKLSDAEQAQNGERAELETLRRELERDIDRMEQRHARKTERLRHEVDVARSAYERAMRDWQG